VFLLGRLFAVLQLDCVSVLALHVLCFPALYPNTKLIEYSYKIIYALSLENCSNFSYIRAPRLVSLYHTPKLYLCSEQLIPPNNLWLRSFIMKNTTLSLSLLDVRLKYLAEGAANVIYRILPPSTDPSTAADLSSEPDGYDSDSPLPTEISPLQLDPRLQGRLIRLRKTLPSTAPVADSQHHFEDQIYPLFQPENLLEATLFHPSKCLLKACNTNLRFMERTGTRPLKRHNVYLVENEPHGCLITDMSSSLDDATSKCIEFKPKWLVQSPSAPAGARRCRTCALRAMKRAGTEKESSKASFCPLNLVSIDRTKLSIFVDHILGVSAHRHPSTDNGSAAREHDIMMKFLYKNPLLDRLRTLQLDLDPDGVFKADLLSPNFLAAMTLRDCTLFLKVLIPPLSNSQTLYKSSKILIQKKQVPTTPNKTIEARLGDLDLKTSSGSKAEYWRSLERKLIDEGWYGATEKDRVQHENFCQLS